MKKTVYICGIDYQHELGEVPDYTKVYSTVADLKRQSPCWEECGIIEIEVTKVRWVEPQQFFRSAPKELKANARKALLKTAKPIK